MRISQALWLCEERVVRVCLREAGSCEFMCGLTLCQIRVRLGIRKHSFSERAVRHRTAAQGGGAVSIPRGAQSCRDVALRELGSGHGGLGWCPRRVTPKLHFGAWG